MELAELKYLVSVAPYESGEGQPVAACAEFEDAKSILEKYSAGVIVNIQTQRVLIRKRDK